MLAQSKGIPTATTLLQLLHGGRSEMTKPRKPTPPSARASKTPSAPADGPRRRNARLPTPEGQIPPGAIRKIDAAPLLETAEPSIDLDASLTFSRALGIAGAMIHATFPALVGWGVTVKVKGKPETDSFETNPSAIAGFSILVLAQVLSAIMGLYTQITYSTYGTHWHENLFYSHFLSLPLFLPLLPSLLTQSKNLMASPPIHLSPSHPQSILLISNHTYTNNSASSTTDHPPPTFTIPSHLLALALNALTQYACIRGVNLLAAQTSALGVSIVLNLRKLISLFLSIWLFGNTLPVGVIVGAAIVFGSAGIWAWESTRAEARRKKQKTKNKKKKARNE
ncbi:MAG: hypothetical protein Q9190_001728 [Brigantiaea leucoxantha]